MTEKELRRITVQEIADRADVNRVTFYKHYLDVYDLYDKVEEELLVEMGLMILTHRDRLGDRILYRTDMRSSKAVYARIMKKGQKQQTVACILSDPVLL
ncbi:MAG: TetR family transcriptional regulator [Oscillospiraceae bacterium]|nr:TetR family transcriptional regulator [Oscillospiraceae bacterium]MBQ9208099.1 TetR family transcriptional regulator [Oscillospiraceae bacterium]